MVRAVSSKRPLVSAKWRKLLRLIPGYDPFANCGECWFEPAIAQKAIDFFQECLTHVEGELAHKPFLLEPWQQSIVANLFGWQKLDRKGRQVRRYRETLIYVPRKNGKTPLVAGICSYVLFCDNEPGAQIYSAAAEREQAALLYRHAKGMIENEPELLNRAKIFAGVGHRSIVLRDDEASSYKVLSADADTKHGGNSHFVAVDELHAQPNRELIDVLQTSMASENRKQPLLAFITTADFDRESICNEKHDYACKVRDGIIIDPSFLPVIYEALPDDDWKSPKTWKKANPNLGISVSLEYLERECKRAQETPTYENTFKRLHLNMKTEQDVLWMPIETWDTCGFHDPLEWRQSMLNCTLAGETCFAGLDLSTTTDLCALTLWFPEQRVAIPYYWAPHDNAEKREKRDRVPYVTWARQGWIELTEGDVVDYDVIRTRITDLTKTFRIKQFAIDRWNATQLATQLQGDGADVVFFGQGFASMSAPTKELEKSILANRIQHGSNPVLRWNIKNAAAEIDAAGNVKLSKKKSSDRIDGAIALIMAMGIADSAPIKKPSVYESRGVLRV